MLTLLILTVLTLSKGGRTCHVSLGGGKGTTPGNRALRSALVEAARGAGRTQATYLGAQYRRLIPRLGPKRAALAVAHSICQRIWIVPDRQEPYADLGVDYFDRRDTEAVKRRALKRLADLGYQVTLEPIPR